MKEHSSLDQVTQETKVVRIARLLRVIPQIAPLRRTNVLYQFFSPLVRAQL